jgi:hypothetical protein
MGKVRPEIPREYKGKIELLQTTHPLTGDAAPLVAVTLSKALAEST